MNSLQKTLEALLYVQGEKGIYPKELKKVFEISSTFARKELKEFSKIFNLRESGLQILEFNDNFKITTREEQKKNISKLVVENKKYKLSASALETIGIIAYKQPTTKSKINDIRGVSSEATVNTLLSKGLVEEVGIAETLGNPVLFGITEKFYDYFQISSLKELPPLSKLEGDNVDVEETFELFSSQREEE